MRHRGERGYVDGYLNVFLGYRGGWEQIIVKFKDMEEYKNMLEQVEAIGEGEGYCDVG